MEAITIINKEKNMLISKFNNEKTIEDISRFEKNITLVYPKIIKIF